ncbi:MAG TPA: cupredoxin domain-containing protein [Ktedonobacteraceae bacterium]|jgi:plastocyanin
MKTFFSTKHRALLIGGVVNLLILCIVVTVTLGPSPGIHAQRAWNQQDPFSVFCNFYYHDGKDISADADTATCNKQSSTFLSLLQQETSSDNYTKWPQQVSLDDIAMAGQLVNPQTKTPIKTQHDFQAAIPVADTDLLNLFQGDSEFLPTVWDYNSTYDYLPPCGTATSNSELPISTCPNQPNQAPSCPVNPQSFQHTDIWPVVGPMLLTTISQDLQDQNGHAIGTYDIYGRLLLQDHCSVATLAQTLKLNGQPIQPNQAYLLEQDALIQTAIANASNTQLLIALVWVVSQNNYQQLDNWFSSAILTDPINSNAQPAPNYQPTPNYQPPPSVQPTFSPLSSVSVASSAPQSVPQSVQQVNIVEKNGKYSFEPPIVIVPKGTTVEWINNSDAAQTIVSDTNAFSASSSCGSQQTIQMVFNTPGPFGYHSGTNPYMRATVIVTS